MTGLYDDGSVCYAYRDDDEDKEETQADSEPKTSKSLEQNTGEGQSAGSPVEEQPKVKFHQYSHVQNYSPTNGRLIGEEEHHSIKEGPVGNDPLGVRNVR